MIRFALHLPSLVAVLVCRLAVRVVRDLSRLAIEKGRAIGLGKLGLPLFAMAFLATYAAFLMAVMLTVFGHFRLAAGFVLVPMIAAAAVVIANELRAVLGRLPSRDFESGDRGAPGLPLPAAVEVGE